MLVIVSIYGAGTWMTPLVIGAVFWPGTARLVRAEILRLRGLEFVEAARGLGGSPARLLARHVVPNALTPVLVQTSLIAAEAVLLESGLSYLGLGAQPPLPSWGNMLAEGRSFLDTAWWVATFPGLAIFVTVLGLNIAGDTGPPDAGDTPVSGNGDPRGGRGSRAGRRQGLRARPGPRGRPAGPGGGRPLDRAWLFPGRRGEPRAHGRSPGVPRADAGRLRPGAREGPRRHPRRGGGQGALRDPGAPAVVPARREGRRAHRDGSDAGTEFNVHGENAREFAFMVDHGLSPMDALLAGTRNGARLLGLEAEVGTVEAGKLADLVAVSDDPLVRIDAVRRPCLVMKGGEVYRADTPARVQERGPDGAG